MSRDFQHFWGGKNSTSGPHMHRQTRFRDMFRFREDVRKKRVSANLLSKKNGRKSCDTVPLSGYVFLDYSFNFLKIFIICPESTTSCTIIVNTFFTKSPITVITSGHFITIIITHSTVTNINSIAFRIEQWTLLTSATWLTLISSTV